MPLKNSTYVPAQDAVSFQVQEERSQPEPSGRSSTLSHITNDVQSGRNSNTSRDFEALNPLGARDISDKNKKALEMKMSVPETIGSRSMDAGNQITVVSGKGDLKTNARLQDLTMEVEPGLRTKPTFDDTASIAFSEESFLQDNDSNTMVFRGNPGILRRHYLKPRNSTRDYTKTFDANENLDNFAIPDNLEDIARATEKQLQEQQRQDHVGKYKKPTFDFASKYHPDIHMGRPTRDNTGTPSRSLQGSVTHNARNGTTTKVVSFDSPAMKGTTALRLESPELEVPREKPPSTLAPETHGLGQKIEKRGIARSSANNTSAEKPLGRLERSQRTTDELTGHPPQNNTFEYPHTSEYPTSSEDEVLPVQSRSLSVDETIQERQNPRKRHQEEHIDYDLHTLKAMKFDDLDKEDFGRDPKHRQREPTFDSLGNPMTLLQRLSNLGKMSEEEQKTMFRSQNDKEWVQMGSWFIDRFQEDLKKLMDIRLERRKISLRFENEIRQRQKEIDWCANGVEEELRGLRKGGDELIKGRDIPSRRGTPQKN